MHIWNNIHAYLNSLVSGTSYMPMAIKAALHHYRGNDASQWAELPRPCCAGTTAGSNVEPNLTPEMIATAARRQQGCVAVLRSQDLPASQAAPSLAAPSPTGSQRKGPSRWGWWVQEKEVCDGLAPTVAIRPPSLHVHPSVPHTLPQPWLQQK